MNNGSTPKRLLNFIRDLSILVFINMLGVYIICKLAGSYTAKSFGNLMIGAGVLYMTLGSYISGLVDFNDEYVGHPKPRTEWLYAASKIKKTDRNFAYILRWAASGGITVFVGMLLRGL